MHTPKMADLRYVKEFTWRQQYCHLDCYIAGDLNAANLNDTIVK